MNRRSLRILVLAGLLSLASATTAAACPACADLGSSKARWYAKTTVLLTLLPLGGIGAVILWVRKEVLRAGDDGV